MGFTFSPVHHVSGAMNILWSCRCWTIYGIRYVTTCPRKYMPMQCSLCALKELCMQ